MTKVEYKKCEELMDEAIRYAIDSDVEYEEYRQFHKKKKRN